MNRTKTIARNGSDNGLTLTALPNRIREAIGGGKKYLAIGLILLLVISVLLVLSSGISFEPKLLATPRAPQGAAKFNLIKAPDLKDWLDQGRSFLLIDARTPEQFADGHIPTAVNRQFSRPADTRSKEKERDRLMVFYCSGYSGSKYDPCSRAVIQELQNDSNQVYWFKEGMVAWQALGYPVMQSP